MPDTIEEEDREENRLPLLLAHRPQNKDSLGNHQKTGFPIFSGKPVLPFFILYQVGLSSVLSCKQSSQRAEDQGADKSAGRIETDITELTGSSGNKTLVKFIRTRIKKGKADRKE